MACGGAWASGCQAPDQVEDAELAGVEVPQAQGQICPEHSKFEDARHRDSKDYEATRHRAQQSREQQLCWVEGRH